MKSLFTKSILQETVNGKSVHFFFLSSFGDQESVHIINFGVFYESSQVNLFCSVDTSVVTGSLETIQKFLNKYFNNRLPNEISNILGDISICLTKS